MQRRQIMMARGRSRLADHEDPTGGIVRDRVYDADLPIGDPAVDDLETRRDAVGRLNHVGRGDAGACQPVLEDESDFGLGAWLNEAMAVDIYCFAMHPHSVRQKTEIRLVDAEHVLNRFGGHANLLADHSLAIALPHLDLSERDRIGSIDP